MPKNIEDLEGCLDSRVISLLRNNGYCEIWNGQWECIQKSLIEQKSSVICLPTGSGKTLPALLSTIDAVFNKKGKAVYIVPLRALAKQKYDEFKKVMSPLGIKVGISTGDFAKDEYTNIGTKDVIITTFEKMDSFIRHNEDWIYDVSLFVIDEIQMVDDPSRGLTLEMVTSEILRRYPTAQRIAISAVIGNPEEFKNWLDGELIFNEERIVPLQMGVFTYEGMLSFRGRKTEIQLRNNLYKFEIPKKDPEKRLRYSNTIDLTKYLVNEKKQCIIFTSTR
jgi:helicase